MINLDQRLSNVPANEEHRRWLENEALWKTKIEHYKRTDPKIATMAEDIFTMLLFVGVTLTNPLSFEDMIRFLWLDAFLRSTFFNKLRKKTVRNPGLAYIATQRALERWAAFYRGQTIELRQGLKKPEIGFTKGKTEFSKTKQSLLKRLWEWIKRLFVNPPPSMDQHEKSINHDLQQENQAGFHQNPASFTIDATRMDLDVAAVLGDVLDAESLSRSLGQRRPRWHDNSLNVSQFLDRQRGLRGFADQIGRMMAIANRSIRENGIGMDTEYDLCDDISSILPSELAMGAHPLGQELFIDRYNKGALWGMEQSEEPERKRGSMVVLIDVSESITGEKERDEKALALGLYEIAKAREQDFHVILFSGIGEHMILHFTGDSRDEDLKELLITTYYGHGTYYAEAIVHALRIFEDDLAQGGDMVLLTDGEFKGNTEFTNRFTTDKQRLGFRLFGVLFNQQNQPALEEIADKLFQIQSLESDAATLFQGVFM